MRRAELLTSLVGAGDVAQSIYIVGSGRWEVFECDRSVACVYCEPRRARRKSGEPRLSSHTSVYRSGCLKVPFRRAARRRETAPEVSPRRARLRPVPFLARRCPSAFQHSRLPRFLSLACRRRVARSKRVFDSCIDVLLGFVVGRALLGRMDTHFGALRSPSSRSNACFRVIEAAGRSAIGAIFAMLRRRDCAAPSETRCRSMWPVRKSSHSFRTVYDSGVAVIAARFDSLRLSTGSSPASRRVRISCHSAIAAA